ncbi:FUSC family protein [Oceanobacillus senegalensis]|uniref:FUSC family protein n=1 Tax=Oceanobacillus senegalensis TaxID=1936063 RepID=UPI000A304829|nr:aromatic acid exporter family protein [Oceanobacillus senegalensis]
MEFNIGPRMVKTGLAVAVTLLFTGMIGLKLEIVAAIAAVLAMQPSIMRSFAYIKEVLISNGVAVIFALLGTVLLGIHPLSVGAVVIISIAINIRLGLNKTVSLTALTIMAMMLASDDTLNFIYIIERISLIAIGVMSAFVVNVFVFPPNHKKNLYNMIKNASNKMNFLMRVIPNNTMSIPKKKEEDREIEKLITKVKDYYEIIADERNRLFIRNKKDFLRSIVIYKHMIRVLEKQYTLIVQLEKNLEGIENTSSGNTYLIKKLVSEMNGYSENVLLMYEEKIKLDSDLQKETKQAMRLTINNLIEELQGSSFEKWSYVFPVSNGIIELFNELDKLERLVRFNELKVNKTSFNK